MLGRFDRGTYFGAFLRISEVLTVGADQISWRRALDTIDVRIGLCSQSGSGSLRYLREIIWKVHADFHANLRERGPSSFALLVPSTDGRTADSKYPNLLLPKERERFGL